MIYEILWMFILAIYVISVTYSTKYVYEWMIKKGAKKKDAVYYDRKLIHIFSGGVITLIVPFVFNSPYYPLICGLGLTALTYFSHKSGRRLYWFQTEDNQNDVHFCFMWGLSIFILWLIIGNPWIAVIPAAFMAFGDGITGIVRNAAFKKRSKHPIGNVYMGCVCVIIGYYLGNLGARDLGGGILGGMALGGVIAAIAASFVERYELGPLDDNVLITIASSIVLYVWFIADGSVIQIF